MKWNEFELKVKKRGIGIFTTANVQRALGSSPTAARFLTYRWAKQGRVIRLKRGTYKFADVPLPDVYIANKIYEPSYVSLEFALSFHQIIPESVYSITSVTTRVTRKFTANGKQFIYRRIKSKAFSGYVPKRQDGFTFHIAEPEKAFVDLNYLRLLQRKPPLSRFAKEKLNKKEALRFASLFENEKLISIIKTTL